MKSAFVLDCWRIREANTALKSGRLDRDGWLGMTMCHVSRFELARIRAFIRTLAKENVCCFKVDYFAHGFGDNDYGLREASVWLRRQEDWDALAAFVRSLPPRSATISVSDYTLFDQQMSKALKHINHELHFNGWPDDTVLSIQEDRAPMAKLMLG